jgi:hypothetical protein
MINFSAFMPAQALIKRELLTTLRTRRAFWGVLLIVAFCLIFPVTQWPSQQVMFQMVQWSQAFFWIIVWILYIASLLIVPALAGASVVSEKENDTFELLAVTHIRPWSFLLGKLVNTAGYYLLMVIALMPLVAIVSFLIGLDQLLLLRTFLIITASTLSAAAAGIYCSCRFRRPALALAASYFCTLALTGLLFVPPMIALLIINVNLAEEIAEFVFRAVLVSSAPSALVALVDAPRGIPNGLFGIHGSTILFAVHALISVGSLWMANRRLRIAWGVASPWSRKREARAKKKRHRKNHQPLGDWINPVLVKEFRYDFNLRGRVGAWIFGGVLAVSFLGTTFLIFVARFTRGDYDPALYLWLIFEMIALNIAAPAFLANIFTKEMKSMNADALRMSLVRPYQIVAGKAMAGAAVIFMLTTPAVLSGIPLLLISNRYEWIIFAVGLITMTVNLFLSGAVTLCASAAARNMGVALATSYVMLAMLFVGNIALVGLFEIYRFVPLDEDLFASLLTPYVALVVFLDDVERSSTAIDIVYAEGFWYWLLSMALYTGLALATLWLCYVTYRWRQRRET